MRGRHFQRLWSVTCALLSCACSGTGEDDEPSSSSTDGDLTASGDGSSAGGDGDGSTTSGDGDGSSGCDVPLLLETECGSCHGAEPAYAELDLVSPGLDERLVDQPSVSCADWPLVVAGSPERSNLYQKVASDAPPCGERMPPENDLTQAQVDCIAGYIVDLGGDEPVETCETCGGTTCVDTMIDPTHCGVCNAACDSSQICADGVCTGCTAGLTSCDGSCVDVTTSGAHCGACGNACGGGQSCVDGTCQCDAGDAIVSFAADIQPLLTAQCADAGCHSDTGGRPGGPPGGNSVTSDLVLSEGVAYGALLDQPSACNGLDFVEPGDVSASYLMNKLTGVDMCGGTVMPKGAAQLSQSELDAIGSWICAGAPNN